MRGRVLKRRVGVGRKNRTKAAFAYKRNFNVGLGVTS